MKISSNTDVSSKKYAIDKLKENENIAATEQKKKAAEKEEIGAALQTKKHPVRSEAELNNIIIDIVERQPMIENPDEMIRKANENILNNSNDAVLAQANSTSERVAELLN